MAQSVFILYRNSVGIIPTFVGVIPTPLEDVLHLMCRNLSYKILQKFSTHVGTMNTSYNIMNSCTVKTN